MQVSTPRDLMMSVRQKKKKNQSKTRVKLRRSSGVRSQILELGRSQSIAQSARRCDDPAILTGIDKRIEDSTKRQ
jgi:hypothetical protein